MYVCIQLDVCMYVCMYLCMFVLGIDLNSSLSPECSSESKTFSVEKKKCMYPKSKMYVCTVCMYVYVCLPMSFFSSDKVTSYESDDCIGIVQSG